MRSRVELHNKLKELLGSNNVYFQPPESLKLKFPCIVYNLTSIQTMYANDNRYRNFRCYQVTYITSDPDTDMIDRFLDSIEYSSFDRCFTSDRLDHNIFTVYY